MWCFISSVSTLAFDGLNLTWETLEGLAKHNGPLAARSESAGGEGELEMVGLRRWRSLGPPYNWAAASQAT